MLLFIIIFAFLGTPIYSTSIFSILPIEFRCLFTSSSNNSFWNDLLSEIEENDHENGKNVKNKMININITSLSIIVK